MNHLSAEDSHEILKLFSQINHFCILLQSGVLWVKLPLMYRMWVLNGEIIFLSNIEHMFDKYYFKALVLTKHSTTEPLWVVLNIL